MSHLRRRTGLTVLLAASALAPVVGAGGALPAGAAPTSPVRIAAVSPAPAPDCAGALTPVPGPVGSPYGGSFVLADAAGPSSVFVVGIDTSADGSWSWVVRHGPAAGPFTVKPLPVTRDDEPSALVAVDAQHAWVAGRTYAPGLRHSSAAVWRVAGNAVAEVPIPAGLLDASADTRVTALDASSDHDVWVGVSELSGGELTYLVLHWDGVAWSTLPGLPSGGDLRGLAAAGSGAALAMAYTPTDGQSHWYSHAGAAWREITGTTDGPPLTHSSQSTLTVGHGHPLAWWTDTSGTTTHLSQWRDGSWHPLTPPGGDYIPTLSVAADGSVWSRPLEFISTRGSYLSPQSIAVLDGTTWVRSGTLDDQKLGVAGPSDVLVPLDATTAIAAGHDQTGHPAMRRSCFATVSSSGVTDSVVQTEVGLTIAVRGTPDLAGPVAIRDTLKVVAPAQVAPGHWAQLTYPWAGTFTAAVGSGLGSVTTTTAMDSWEWRTGTSRATVYHSFLRLASTKAPAGWTLEVQQQLPGTTTWRVLTRTTGPQLELPPIPVTQRGTWHFRARLVRTDATASSGWSRVSTVERRDVAP